MQVCSKCQRRIPSWTDGLCPCSPIGHLPSTGIELQIFRKEWIQQDDLPQPRPRVVRLRNRLDGFNQLLFDVYDAPVRISEVLIKQSVPPERLVQRKSDEVWLSSVMYLVDKNLTLYLDQVIPNCKAQVISYWYGLGISEAKSVKSIARKLSIPTFEVETTIDAVLAHLRSEDGSSALEKIILAASKEAYPR